MFCKKCGTKLDDDALFCENCGTSTLPSQKKDGSAGLSTGPIEPIETPPVSISSDTKISSKPKRRVSYKWVVLLIVAVLGIIAAVLLIPFDANTSSDDFYHELNYNNNGFFAYDSNRLYFIGKYTDSDVGDSVFSTDYNGVNKKLISSNDDIIRIRVVDNKIYYVENCGEEYRIGVMNDDGSENKTIATAEEFITKMAIQNNVLYYLTDSKLFTSNLDGTDSKVLIENADTFVVGKNALYYVSNDVITEYNLKKQTFTELISGSDISNLALNAESLYYSCNKGLYCLKTDGSRSVSPIISDSDLGSYTFFDNNIYYISEYSTDELDVFAEALAENYDVTPLTLKLVLIGTGSLYKANIDGSNAYEVEDTDDSIAFALYTSPGGLYHKFSAFSDNVEKIVF